jgi:nucleotidyltransferase/DNA polymerase involved in DNA repair
MQKYILDHFYLPCSIGVASNKLVAKIATDTGKASKRSEKPPNAILVVPSGNEAEFLAPLPTKALWGIGPKTSERLANLGIHTIGDISRWPEVDRKNIFGKYGNELAKRSLGIDESLVQTSHIVKSISNEITFSNDISDVQILHETLHNLSESVGHRLRKNNLVGKTVKLKLRWKNFTTLTKQSTLSIPTNDDNEIYHSVKSLFSLTWHKGKPIRLLGIGVSQLTEPPGQLSLWVTDSQKDGKLLSAVDVLKEKYGKNVIIRGSELINIDPEKQKI